jgi:hypothetical protein
MHGQPNIKINSVEVYTMQASWILLVVRVLLLNDKQYDSPINFHKPLNFLNYGAVQKPFKWVQ